MSETNTITRPEFRAYQRDVDGRLGAVQKGIEALAEAQHAACVDLRKPDGSGQRLGQWYCESPA